MTNVQQQCHILCLNPVLDLIFESRRLAVERRLFFDKFTMSSGGFGPNASRALHCIGCASTSYLITGGYTGNLLRKLMKKEGLRFKAFDALGQSRLASIWLNGPESTMLVSPSPYFSTKRIKDIFALMRRATRSTDIILIGGSVHVDYESEVLAQINKLCCERPYCCIDIRTLRWMELRQAKPYILKLPATITNNIPFRKATAMLEDVVRAGATLALCSFATTVLLARTAKTLYIVKAPRVRVSNPYGAGDCLFAVLSTSVKEGRFNSNALKLSVGAAVASLTTAIPGQFDSSEATRLASKVRIMRRDLPL